MPWRRTAIGLFVVIVFAVGLYAVIDLVAERYVSGQLEEAAGGVCALVDAHHPPVIAVDLFERSVSITGLILLPAADCSGTSLRVQGRIDSVHVSGVSLTGLLFRDRAVLDELHVSIADLRIAMVDGSLRSISNDQVKNELEPWSIAIGSFALAARSISVITQAGDTIGARDHGLEVEGKDLHFLTGQAEPLGSLRVETVHLTADSLFGGMASGYKWSVGNCAFDQEQGTLDLLRTNIGPGLGLEAFSATLPFETDVIEARLDTIHIAGFDMNTAFAENAWSMRSVRLASGAVTVLRDKVVVDGNDPEKPLLSRLIRSFPQGSGADSIIVQRLDVEYHERVDRQRGYAVIPITQIDATITGAKHTGIDTSALVVRANAVAFNAASVSMVMRAVVADTTDRFEIEASIGPMPFHAINRATGPLLDIQATEGRIDSLIYRMTADDRRASGMVRMNHRGLKLASGGRRSERTGNQIESAVLNALVRKTSRNKIGNARDGRFAFDRRRDRAIFNYLWSGLREGVKAELLPEALTK
jgi:hypothetical protein